MEKLTFQELKERLADWKEEFLDGDFDYDELGDITGTFEKVDSGGFDSDSYYSSVKVYRVYHFFDHDIFIRFEGYISSYEGCEFERMVQVEPIQKLVTVYETI